jgi:gamma-glutamylcyclotransferase (GGCT)/AIG2-like uncharacterized protein YtfP
MNPSEPRRLFVYGSLMEGFSNYERAFRGRVISRMPGLTRGLLYHQPKKGYPAMIPGDNWVNGELLELEDFDELLKTGDLIEGYEGPLGPDNEYDRRTAEIETAGGKFRAWAYWYGRKDLGGAENPIILIPDGDWRRFMEAENGKGGADG